MKVFSPITRTDPSPASHGESHAEFLDRVSGTYWDQIRHLVEDWFSRLPPDAKSDVRGRLRSTDNRQSNGAFLELYLHECLLRMGYTVRCHPDVEGTSRRPDYLAEKDGMSIYVEARSASPSDAAVAEAALVNQLYASLDKIHSPNFFLWVEIERQGHAPLRAKPLRGQLEKWLAGLDPDEHDLAWDTRPYDLPGRVFEVKGWKIGFRAVPKSPEGRGRRGVRPLGIFGGGQADTVRDEQIIRGALTDKGSAYGSLGAPYIVAVASNSISLDDHDVFNALYGSELIEFRTYPDGREEADRARATDGYWNRGDHWGHRKVSAVLVVKNIHPAFVSTQQHTIWEHPDPEFAVDRLLIWRRAVPKNGSITFVEPEVSQAAWFGLGEPWPVGEPFPRHRYQ